MRNQARGLQTVNQAMSMEVMRHGTDLGLPDPSLKQLCDKWAEDSATGTNALCSCNSSSPTKWRGLASPRIRSKGAIERIVASKIDALSKPIKTSHNQPSACPAGSWKKASSGHRLQASYFWPEDLVLSHFVARHWEW